MFDIEQTRRIDWSDVVKNNDGTLIEGVVGYSLELEGTDGAVHPFPPIGTPLYSASEADINFFEAGIEPGNYTLYARTHATYGPTVTRVSPRSVGFPLDLRRFQSPAAPDGLTVS